MRTPATSFRRPPARPRHSRVQRCAPAMTEPRYPRRARQDSFALVEVSRIDWISLARRARLPSCEYHKYETRSSSGSTRPRSGHRRDKVKVDYRRSSRRRFLGYQSVMIDASRLSSRTYPSDTGDRRPGARLGVPWRLSWVRARHETGRCRRTRSCSRRAAVHPPDEARDSSANQAATGCPWPSATSMERWARRRGREEVEARLALDHLSKLADHRRPLVLHGGSGIRQQDMLASMKRGIAKVNAERRSQAYSRR